MLKITFLTPKSANCFYLWSDIQHLLYANSIGLTRCYIKFPYLRKFMSQSSSKFAIRQFAVFQNKLKKRSLDTSIILLNVKIGYDHWLKYNIISLY